MTVRLDEAIGVEPARRQVLLRAGGSLAYGSLVLATGVEYDCFGHDTWTPFAPSLKSLQDATEIRRRLLLAFEHAENCPDPDLRRRLLTIVLVGGGPTEWDSPGRSLKRARFPLERNLRMWILRRGASFWWRQGRTSLLLPQEVNGLCRHNP